MPSSGALLPLLMSPLAVAPCGAAVAAPALHRAPDAARAPRTGAPPFVCAAACCACSEPACVALAWAAAAAAERAARLSGAGEAAAAPALPLPMSPGHGAAPEWSQHGRRLAAKRAGLIDTAVAALHKGARKRLACGQETGNKRSSLPIPVTREHAASGLHMLAGLLGSTRAPASAHAGAHPTGRRR